MNYSRVLSLPGIKPFQHPLGCRKALFFLTCSLTSRGNPVIVVTSLGASKAFDVVNYFGLFLRFMCICVPACLLHVLIDWRLKLKDCVLCNGVFCL